MTTTWRPRPRRWQRRRSKPTGQTCGYRFWPSENRAQRRAGVAVRTYCEGPGAELYVLAPPHPNGQRWSGAICGDHLAHLQGRGWTVEATPAELEANGAKVLAFERGMVSWTSPPDLDRRPCEGCGNPVEMRGGMEWCDPACLLNGLDRLTSAEVRS